ncbi:MAG: HNH endonuclease [Gammaproteobacteria bacterium]|nr:HNH endonuclease [Gammaproteobacteria bacterium]MYF30485.1 HNH endonuclease [Gammaproteobacteria bacterium]MYK47566.1 HNH endonuclease [Gammaproteobacteria bacterium]
MKIGALVKRFIPGIVHHCETGDHAELDRLFDPRYAKRVLGINYPFFREAEMVPASENRRYWKDSYVVCGLAVRTTSQWFESNRDPFEQYLLDKGIATEADLADLGNVSSRQGSDDAKRSPAGRANTRYKGNAIGNAQNYLVRNILSNLGEESFGESAWEKTKERFGQRCVYCGTGEELVMDHAVPINRTSLGEHRLGNLVPSCRKCNSRKSDDGYREFLGDDSDRIEAIERHMEEEEYVPLGDNCVVRMILDLAHEEVAKVADRYVVVLNSVLEGRSGST